jgi:hypothetical protein
VSDNQNQLNRLGEMSADQRFEHFLETVNEEGELFILCDDDGFVLVRSDDEECIPVWPDSDSAAAWATDEWEGCEPMGIDLDSWLDRWTPGLEGDKLNIVVHPMGENEVVVSTPAELAAAIQGVEEDADNDED